MADGTWTYTWEHGRRLASMTDGTTTWSYSYNADGLRTGRTDGTNTYQYVYTGGQLSAMYHEGTKYFFHYDGSTPVAMCIGGTPFYYAVNINGDVVAIFDKDGNRVVEYTYDAWGNILSVSGSMADTIGAINPLRYRGYVYDRETGLYYLQSRYYSPKTGRFLNADGYTSTGQGILGNNMFAYCDNNPVCYIDPTGTFKIASYITTFIERIKALVEKAVESILDAYVYTEDIYLNQSQMERNATVVYKYLMKRGWSHNAICATLGNMQQESNINPGMTQRGGGAFGIVQWDPATKYTTWAQNNGYAYSSMSGQLNFLIYSMQPGKGEWFKNREYPDYYLPSSDFVCSNSSIDYLTAVFLYSYERAGTPNLQKRMEYALFWSEYFS